MLRLRGMSQDIRDFLPPECDLLGLGEPTHLEPAFGRVRNELFGQLVEHGFRSIALETDRVAALAVNDFVQQGVGSYDAAMSEGFSHDFGKQEPNRELVAWMRDENETRAPAQRLAFYGFDAAMETMSAPSPRPYLEHARDHVQLDVDIASIAGDDDRWSRTEAVLDPARSPGATADAERLRSIADELHHVLHAKAPELIAATSRAEWLRARTYLTAGTGLLRYHREAARRVDDGTRWNRMCATRDVLMAENLLDIRDAERRRGATLVFAHNAHLQRNLSTMRLGPMDLSWFSAGAIVGSMLGDQYRVIIGRQNAGDSWSLTKPTTPDPADAVLHVPAT